MTDSFRKYADSRLAGLRTDRYSWWQHWRECADYILPRRYRWLITPNEATRGSPINGRILDSTGTIAVRVCAAGMMSGITSPTRPWFKLRIEGFDTDPTMAVNLWLAEVEKRMMRVFAESNFYNSIAIVYMDLAVFGTAAMLMYQDYDDVLRCWNPCAGEYYLANGPRGDVQTFAREFTLTAAQMVAEYGEDKVSAEVKSLNSGPGNGKSQERVICHLVEPNDGKFLEVAKHFKYREIFWERGGQDDKALRIRGYGYFCALAPRWDLTGNDAYGRGPGMEALGDIKQLQQETKRKAQAIDKMVNPPMRASYQLKNQPASSLPGGLTYVANLATDKGIEPIYSVMPPVQELMQDIKEIQERIRTIFFNDLFMMISQLQTVRSATEIDARREEKLVMLGPVLERFQNEALDPAIENLFFIMNRGGLLPPPPPEIQGAPIQVEYVSMLAEAQRAVSTSGIERLWAQAGNLAAARPDVLDNLDFDQGLDEYASLLGVSPKFILAPEAVAKMRQARAQQQEQAQLLQQTVAGAQGAKNLSQTDVGGGQNALQAMLQGPSQ